jgi:hypothetical protein
MWMTVNSRVRHRMHVKRRCGCGRSGGRRARGGAAAAARGASGRGRAGGCFRAGRLLPQLRAGCVLSSSPPFHLCELASHRGQCCPCRCYVLPAQPYLREARLVVTTGFVNCRRIRRRRVHAVVQLGTGGAHERIRPGPRLRRAAATAPVQARARQGKALSDTLQHDNAPHDATHPLVSPTSWAFPSQSRCATSGALAVR